MSPLHLSPWYQKKKQYNPLTENSIIQTAVTETTHKYAVQIRITWRYS